ncbi:DUF4133 domain-containing protein [Sphingobacterium sp. HJSM2_6]|uniref:DUF4133 domain-containing protein n=1 Tax=Sphingobacterium sp. HJSM2_6 TaxID=3366264 RepID=UPI003BE37125
MASVYIINKGVNQALEFKGLKAQYIWYLGGGILVLMILFAVLYYLNVPSWVCVLVILFLGVVLLKTSFSMSRKYGQHGLMKQLAKSQIPRFVKSQHRLLFRLEK